MICSECMRPAGQLGIDDYSDELRTFRRCHECHYWVQAANKQAAGTLFVTADWRAYRPSEMKGAKSMEFEVANCPCDLPFTGVGNFTGTVKGRFLFLDFVPERFRGKLVVNAKIVEGVTA